MKMTPRIAAILVLLVATPAVANNNQPEPPAEPQSRAEPRAKAEPKAEPEADSRRESKSGECPHTRTKANNWSCAPERSLRPKARPVTNQAVEGGKL